MSNLISILTHHLTIARQNNSPLALDLQRTIEALRAAQSLVSRLEVIHNDSHYLSVWQMYQIHGGNYENGPKYDKELETLTKSL